MSEPSPQFLGAASRARDPRRHIGLVQHLRAGDPRLAEALQSDLVCVHPFIIGELACGNLRNRSEILTLLGHLNTVPSATDAEALAFIDNRALMNRGIGFVDVHLLASAALSGIPIWTHDKRLAAVAAELNLDVA